MLSSVVQQLDLVRRTGRWLLITQRLMQWISAMTALVIALGLVDFLLRFPGWLRLVAGIVVLSTAALWLVTRLRHCHSFRPSLGEIALRAERMYPQLSGLLATAVEFTVHDQQYRDPPRTAQLARATVDRASARLQGVHLMKLLDLSRSVRLLVDMAVVLAVMTALLIVAPHKVQIAASRWFMPLGAAQWPKRTEVVSHVFASVWPTDAPLRLGAAVRRGYHERMRVWASYRFVDRNGETGLWQSGLMNEQGAQPGRFERLIDLPPGLIRDIERAPVNSRAAVQFRFEAGDDTTRITRIPLVPRPSVQGVKATLTPPPYAAGLVSAQKLDLRAQTTSVATATALTGSTVSLDVQLNKPMHSLSVEETTPDLPTSAELAPVRDAAFAVRFKLDQTQETPINLRDEFGLMNLSEQRYRFEAIEDRAPTVSVVQPAADESVLASAVLGVEALAQDDVGLRELVIQAEFPSHPDSHSEQTATVNTLLTRPLRQALAAAQTKLDLKPFGLRPGQVVELWASAQDVYELDGERHQSVRSAPRRLRIIDAATLIGQLRSELALLRRNAIRLERTQRQIADFDSERALIQQDQLSERLENQGILLERLQGRAEKNRLDESALVEMMNSAARLLDRATTQSAVAHDRLGRADAASARPAQDQVSDALQKLVSLLDQGRDALTLQLALRQLRTQQEAVAQDTRELLPRTVGRAAADLPDAARRRLDKLEGRQAALGRQAEQMVRQMQTTAEALRRQGESDRDAAAAEALAEAAAIAQRQGLGSTMQSAAASTRQNRLSQAGQQQSDALETMAKMLSELGQQDRLMQAILRRRLQALAAALEKLIQLQTSQIAALEVAENVAVLEPGQASLRRATMAAQDQALASEKTRPVGPIIGDAATAQGEAIVALRDRAAAAARIAETRSLNHLEAALQQVLEARERMQQESLKQQRAELEEAYRELAGQQTELSQRTAEVVDAGPMNRAQRGKLVAQAPLQQEVRDTATELKERVGATLVFKHLHGRIDETSLRVVTSLQQGEADSALVADQKQIVQILTHMAEALADDPEQEKFADGGAGGGGGGAGGSGAGQRDVVPPVAELRLVRGIQQSLLEATQLLKVSSEYPPGAMIKRRVRELSTRQRELADLSQQMIEAVSGDQELPAGFEEGEAR